MPSDHALNRFIQELQHSGFEGDIESSYAQRVVAATDNSIYQLMPLAILYPRVTEDIQRAMSCVFKHRQQGFSLCARGGGTGTNGQSLSDNLVLDCSRHLNRIVAFDSERHTVTVQPGVVLDQLNAFLQSHGLFFPIDISSSSRATIGGMVATDASGKGSLIYGKTSRYIESLQMVLANGASFVTRPLALEQMDLEDDIFSDILLPCLDNINRHQQEIERVFPVMDRGLTGYNLQQAITQDGLFDPGMLVCGSEGTLAITSEITLRVVARPAHKMLTVVFYSDFQRALEHVQSLLESAPSAIEMLDDRILKLARNNRIWRSVQSILGDLPADKNILATHFIEHVGHSEAEMLEHRRTIEKILSQSSEDYAVVLSKTETDRVNISALWELRKSAVGLLGQSENNKKGVAFVEDSAVPPHNLPSYIAGFRALLDEYNLEYGMYGHADAGVLHVRPVLDLMQASDRKLVRRISDRVAQLARQNGGVLWGEHGRGFRGEYAPLFFGETLYPVICDIKNSFDPFNLLNPGKLVTPDPEQAVVALDDIMLRGELDAQINAANRRQYQLALECNGNGACYNWQVDEAMCPSYKATRDKLYSPKGRAAMLREWARLQSTHTPDGQLSELESTLHKSLQHCLSCKSCSTACPLKVDIPELKSRFLHTRPRGFRFSLSALTVRHFESLVASGRKVPLLSNRLLANRVFSSLIKATTGLHRFPMFSRKADYQQFARPLDQLNANADNSRAVILIRDNYMQGFDHETLLACSQLFTFLGYKVYLSDVIHNAKLLHVKGHRDSFKRQAERIMQQFQRLNETGLPLISPETVMRLMVDFEYAVILQQQQDIKLQSVEQFLWSELQHSEKLPQVSHQQPVYLLPHCMEQSADRQSATTWKAIFNRLGIKLEVIYAGCCGMSGLFGHEVVNAELSDKIFNLSWQPKIQALQQRAPQTILASGFSCRCQCHNHDVTARHPVQYLISIIDQSASG